MLFDIRPKIIRYSLRGRILRPQTFIFLLCLLFDLDIRALLFDSTQISNQDSNLQIFAVYQCPTYLVFLPPPSVAETFRTFSGWRDLSRNNSPVSSSSLADCSAPSGNKIVKLFYFVCDTFPKQLFRCKIQMEFIKELCFTKKWLTDTLTHTHTRTHICYAI